MKNVLTPARGAILAALFVGAGMTADAQLRSALDVGERATRSAGQAQARICLLYTSPSPRDKRQSRMPSSA